MPQQNSPFPIEAFSELAAREASHWWFRARNKILLWILSTKIKPKSSYLEVGCGTGFVLAAVARSFPQLRLEATEYFDAGLSVARQRTPACRFREMDALTMGERNQYACIGCFDVLEHIANDERVIANFYQALEANGSLLLTVPQHQWLWSAADDFAHHVRRYSRREILTKLRRVGFRVTYVSSFVSLLLPLMVAQRSSAPRKAHEAFTINDILAIHPLLNHILYATMLVEYALLRLGLTFPAGGSLVVVALKA
jgi:2-polyprenyl-3-methyl-5-hydroxy-6-metoxy-1,4-benzoquinol methylase